MAVSTAVVAVASPITQMVERGVTGLRGLL